MFPCCRNDLVEAILMVQDKEERIGRAVLLSKYKGSDRGTK